MDLTAPPVADPLDLALARELRAGEQVLWHDRPLPRVSGRSFALYIFAVPWTAFSLFWTVMAAGGVASGWDGIGWIGLAFPLFGLPFIAIGVGMLATPFAPLFMARRLVFAITDQRLLRISLWRRLDTRSVEANRIGTLSRSEARDGSGTLSVVIGTRRDSDGDQVLDRFDIGEVANIMAVEDHVRDLAQRADSVSS